MISRILVALDASPRAPDVFAVAAELAAKCDARMWLLRVVAVPPEFPPAAHVHGGDTLPEHMRADAVKGLTPLLNGPGGDRVEATLVTFGMTPWREIVAEAEKMDADLIVIGSHGFSGLDRVLGTTAGAVANHARRNVFVVHREVKP